MPADAFAKKEFQAIVADLLGESGGESGGRAGFSDATAGSVVRTLMESFARELALCYEQLEVVWRAGYIDTAEGQALDNVVALLGLERQRAGFLVGAVEFSRGQPAEADIAIPSGTLVAGRGVPPAETSRDATLLKGDRVARVDVQSMEPSADGKPVPAGALTLMPRPIAGIEAVMNTLALVQRQKPETDAELRARARNAVRRAHTGTKASLETAIRACGISEVRVIDSADDPGAAPATVTVFIGDTDVPDETLAAVYAAVREVRPAGIRVTVNRATAVSVRVDATLDLTRDVPPAEQQAVRDRVVADLKSYVGQLAVGEMLRVAKLRAVLAADERVASADATGAQLIDPWIGGVPVGARALLRNGDLQVEASQRVVLCTDEGYPKIALRAPGLRIDVEIVLPEAEVARRAEVEQSGNEALVRVAEALRREVDQATRRRADGGTGALPDIGYDRVWTALLPLRVASARVTVVHERDGRVAVLAGAGERDGMAAGELPRPGAVTVTVAKAGA